MAEQAINVNSVPTQNPTANTKLVGVENGSWVQVPASSVGGSGIMIPELILKPMLIPHTAIPHTTDNELYIWCKFPQDAAFLQHNPRIFLYRRVYHAGYDRVLKNKYPNAPRKMWRNKEKLFSHPIDVFYTSSGKLIRSEFAFGNSDAIRWGNNYIFKLMVDGTTPFTARWFAGLFGYANDDAIRLNRCSRIYLNINGNNNKSIYVKIGFKLVTNVGESSMALCNVRATSWTENITGYEFMGTSFSV